jgi:hypothetical protein
MGRPLTQLQRDLGIYAQEKAYKLLLDVMQSFEIADRPKSEAVACVGSTLLRIAATVAVHCNASREKWLTMCGEVYDLSQQAEREADDE